MKNTHFHIKHKKQSGLSIIELLVALALGATLTAGISGVYLENKRNFVQDEEMARLQENGRFAMGLLKREIKMAGFYAAASSPQPVAANQITNPCGAANNQWSLETDFSIDLIDSFAGAYNTSGGDTLLASCFGAGNIVLDTDVLVLKRTADRPTISNGNYDPSISAGDENIKDWYVQVVNTGGAVMASDITYQQLTATTFPAAVTAANSGIDMWLYLSKIFFIRDYSVDENDGIPTLVMAYLDGDKYSHEALVDGVEAFHVEFGIRVLNTVTGDEDIFFVDNPTAGQIEKFDPTGGDFDRVSVVRVHLLLRTREEIRGYNDTKDYQLGSLAIASADLNHGSATGDFRRRVFTTTVKVRNL